MPQPALVTGAHFSCPFSRLSVGYAGPYWFANMMPC